MASPAAGGSTEQTRDELIQTHLPLVRQVAQRFHVGSGASVEPADLIQLGVLGLIDATEKYDSRRGTSFDSYARFRIKGSILDGLRHLDFLPRSLRRQRRELACATQEAQQRCGGPADDAEIAEVLNVSPDELQELRDRVQLAGITSVEEMTERGAEAELNEALAGRREPPRGPEDNAANHEMRDLLAEVIEELPEKERLVLSFYYYEEMTMREVGEILGVTESRVSQLHSKALGHLRTELAERRLVA